jgi:transposase
MLELMVEHQAGIPLMKPLSGNSRDAYDFGEAVRAHMQQWHTTYGLTYLVADSALYSEANLQKLAQTHIKWITRVPSNRERSPSPAGSRRPPAPGIAHSRLS